MGEKKGTALFYILDGGKMGLICFTLWLGEEIEGQLCLTVWMGDEKGTILFYTLDGGEIGMMLYKASCPRCRTIA